MAECIACGKALTKTEEEEGVFCVDCREEDEVESFGGVEKEEEIEMKSKEKKVKEGESKAEKFSRLAQARMSKALKNISLVGNLAGSSYDYSEEQVKEMEEALHQAVTKTISKFKKAEKKEDAFKFGVKEVG